MEYKKLTNKRNEFPVIIAVVTVSFALAFGTAIFALLKVNKLENEINQLRNEHVKLDDSHSILHDSLLDVMKSMEKVGFWKPDDDSNFEYQLDDASLQDYDEYYPGTDLFSQSNLDKDDDDDDDYDDKDDADDLDEVMEKYVKAKLAELHEFARQEDKDRNDTDADSLLKGGSFTKVGLEVKRHKRDVVATTVDGVLVNSESYADAKNKTAGGKGTLKLHSRVTPKGGDGVHSPVPTLEHSYNSPSYNTRYQGRSAGLKHYEQLSTKPTGAPGAVLARKSRVMHVEDKSKAFRRVVKKPKLKSVDRNFEAQLTSPDVTIIRDVHHRRRHRQRRVESFGETAFIKQRPTIHLNGEVLQSAYGIHENFLGNGRLHHYDRHFINWTRDDWVQNLGMEQYFQVTDGYLTILESGLYMIYAQIFYIDEHDTNGFRVYKNDKMVLQCITSTHTNHRIDKPNTCYTAGVEYITEGDRLRVHDIEANRYSVFEPGKSFFGVIKLGDAKIK